jgi:protein TonB
MRPLLNHLICFTLAALLHLLVLMLAGRHFMQTTETCVPQLELAEVELTLEGAPKETSSATSAASAAAQKTSVTPPEPPESLAPPEPLPEARPIPEPIITTPSPILPDPRPAPRPDLPEIPVEPTPQKAIIEPPSERDPDRSHTTTTPASDSASEQSDSSEAGGSAFGQVNAYPALERTIRPVYPISARRRNEEGTVVLDVTVGADGRASDVALVTSSGYPDLDRAAQRAAAKARFKPGEREGRPVTATARLTLIFRLRDL